jgi:hypothetical protein
MKLSTCTVETPPHEDVWEVNVWLPAFLNSVPDEDE